jgi:hypothetical protein
VPKPNDWQLSFHQRVKDNRTRLTLASEQLRIFEQQLSEMQDIYEMLYGIPKDDDAPPSPLAPHTEAPAPALPTPPPAPQPAPAPAPATAQPVPAVEPAPAPKPAPAPPPKPVEVPKPEPEPSGPVSDPVVQPAPKPAPQAAPDLPPIPIVGLEPKPAPAPVPAPPPPAPVPAPAPSPIPVTVPAQPKAPDPVVVKAPDPVIIPAVKDRTIWLSTHIGAKNFTPEVQEKYGAIMPPNSERLDFYESAIDADANKAFDSWPAANGTFRGRCTAFGGALRSDPVIADWEAGHIGSDLAGRQGSAIQAAALDQFLHLIEALRKYLPNAKIGLYNVPYCSGGYASMLNQADWWLAQETTLAKLWDNIDILAPSQYHGYAFKDPQWSDAKDLQYVTNVAKLCNRIKAKFRHLQILPYYQAIYRMSGADYDQTIVPVSEWRTHIKRFADVGLDGAVWWSGTGSPDLPVSHLQAMREAIGD